MADETLFELLHMEMVSHVFEHVEEEEEEVEDYGKHTRVLEGMGFRVGQGLIERLTRDSPSFKDDLEVMKFVCKDLWTILFKKQIDNLRTNHQVPGNASPLVVQYWVPVLKKDINDLQRRAAKLGTYVLQDNRFMLLTQLSSSKQYLEEAPKFLPYTCGLVKGALSNLGINCTVSAEVAVMPACKFQVVISRT